MQVCIILKGGVGVKRGYIRVSTLQQRTDRQEEQLKNEVDMLYVDKASGSSREGRIELEKMLISKKIDKYESWRIEEYNIPDDCRHCVNDHSCKTYYGSNECTKKWKEVC